MTMASFMFGFHGILQMHMTFEVCFNVCFPSTKLKWDEVRGRLIVEDVWSWGTLERGFFRGEKCMNRYMVQGNKRKEL